MSPASYTARPFAIGSGSLSWIEAQRRSLPAELGFLAAVDPATPPWLSRDGGTREVARLVRGPAHCVLFLGRYETSPPGFKHVFTPPGGSEPTGKEWLAFLPSHQPAPSTGARSDGPIHSFVCSANLFRSVQPQIDPAHDLTYQFACTALQPVCPPVVLPPWRRDEPASPSTSAATAIEDSVTWLIPHRGEADHLHTCLQQVEVDAEDRDSIWVCLDEEPSTAHADLVRSHPTVHFWRSTPAGMGPYVARHILGQAARTNLLLFQDSDDVPVAGRRNALVRELQRSDADMVGSHELRVDERHGEILAIRFPGNANAALQVEVEHPLFHPTSLIRVEALRRAGGFSTIRRFGADLQFLLRAHFTMRLRNCDDFLYVRRKHHGSLTTLPGIGLGESERVQQATRWKEDFVRVRDGQIALAASSLAVEHHPDLHRVQFTYLNP